MTVQSTKKTEGKSSASSRVWASITGSGLKDRLAGLPSRSWRAFSEHHKNRKQREREISDYSRWGLDVTNFFLADVQVGFGSFLAFYLAASGWSKQEVGFALSVGSVTALLAQIPGGAVVDAVHWKRGVAALGIVAIALSAVILAVHPEFHWVLIAEALHGLTAGLAMPSIAAISLGLAGRHGISARIGRNYRFAAAGNALAAAAMGALGAYFQNSAIFYTAACLCVPALLGVWLIRPEEIDYARARNATRKGKDFSLHRFADLARNHQLLLFGGCLVLFHFSNASLLPLISENLGTSKADGSLMLMSALLIGPQIIVAIIAPWIGHWSELWGRKPLVLIGFACETLRAILFVFVSSPAMMIACQLLDGVTGATITILMTLVVADLTTGTGRFNFALGVVGTMTAIAAAVSTTAMGWIAHRAGDTTGFLVMAVTSGLGLATLWMFFKESKPAKYVD